MATRSRSKKLSRSPSAMTIEHLRRNGYRAQSVEKWIPQAKRKMDLFGFIDIVALDPLTGKIVGIQATSGSNVSSRVEKILGERRQEAADWLRCGGLIQVWGWKKVRVKDAVNTLGRKCLKYTYEPRIVNVTLGQAVGARRKKAS